ncbi:MAG: tetratricopeptide repeat protein [Nitrospirota bacterium]
MWAETVKRSPDKQRPHHNFGCALAKAKQYDAAIRAFDDALSKEPDGTVIPHFCYIEIGNAHYHMKRYGDAVTAWKKALALSPGNAEVLTNLAEGLLKQGKADEAWGYIQAALAASSPYPETLEVLGDILLARGEAASAADSFVEAIEKKPDLATAYCGAASAYEKLGRYELAVYYLEQYLSRASDEHDRIEASRKMVRMKEKLHKMTGSKLQN